MLNSKLILKLRYIVQITHSEIYLDLKFNPHFGSKNNIGSGKNLFLIYIEQQCLIFPL